MKCSMIWGSALAVLMTACGGAREKEKLTAPSPPVPTVRTIADGEQMIVRGDYAGAALIFESIVENSPKNPVGHYYLALSKRHLGEPDRAVEHYEEAIRLDDGLIDAHINLGLLLMEKGDLTRAEEELGRHLKESPDDPDAQFNYGLLQETMGDLDRAEIHYKKAADLDPKDPYPIFGLGDLARKRGDKRGAVALYEKARGLGGDTPELLLAQGETLLELREKRNACDLFERLLAMSKSALDTNAKATVALASAKHREVCAAQGE